MSENSIANSIDGLAVLARRTQVMPLSPIQRSRFEGLAVNLVSSATGHLSFSVIDLNLPGVIPISFQRVYASDRNTDSGLGVGWSFVFDDRIAIDGDNATLSTGAGGVAAYRRVKETQTFTLESPEANTRETLRRTDESTIVGSNDKFTRTYKRVGATFRLAKIADQIGNSIEIALNEQGNIARISNSSGSEIAFEWSAARDPRLLAISDNAKRRVTFKHHGSGLRSVIDTAGSEWYYDYQGVRMTRAADPVNRVLLRVRYDKAGHVVEAGDAAGVNSYDYEFNSRGVSRETLITDPLGSKTTVAHTELGAIAAIRDNKGRTILRVDYNAGNRPTKVSAALVGETSYVYDSQNRLIKQSSTDGTFQEYTYDERGLVSSLSTQAGRTDYINDKAGNPILARSDDPAQSYLAIHNPRGQLTRIRSAIGTELSFEYDAAGNTSSFAEGGTGRFELGYDAAGNVVSRKLPSGEVYRYEYDSRGLIARQADNNGRAMNFERDPSGAITGFVTDRGIWVRAVRDYAGRITSLRSSSGKTRQFGYDARGALVDYLDAEGKRKRLIYDELGRVERINSSDGSRTVVERDANGRVAALRTVNGNERPEQSGLLSALRLPFGVSNFAASKTGKSVPRASASPQDSVFGCPFGSDGFGDPLIYTNTEWDCWNPLGPLGTANPFSGFSESGFGAFDPFFDSTITENCPSCIARQQQICDLLHRKGCTRAATGSGFWAVAGCALATAGAGLAFCAVLVSGGLALQGLACEAFYQACLLSVRDRCASCTLT
jgi:YD repeat-containing protein